MDSIETRAVAAAAGRGGLVHRLARLGRFLVFVCSAGWLYPHVCTEGMDLTAIQNAHASPQG